MIHRLIILVTSVDQEGTQNGFDVDLTRSISQAVTIPVIASGGMGQLNHLDEVIQNGSADAVAMAHIFHYGKYSVADVRDYALKANYSMRKVRIPANES